MFAITAEMAQRIAVNFAWCHTCVTHGLGLMSLGTNTLFAEKRILGLAAYRSKLHGRLWLV